MKGSHLIKCSKMENAKSGNYSQMTVTRVEKGNLY